MEWDSRTCAWNGISKLEVEDNSYNHHLAATLACSSGSGLTNMFSVDLNLGRLEDMPDLSMETFNNSVPTNMGPTPPPTSPVMALSKRGRPRNNGAQTTVFCAVDGCTSDLNRCRDYHRRHRVCERHSKTPVVLVAGKEQRFCQQCSRFHSLEEFDEVKRSCRKRLDGHNRRRRKRQPEAFYMPDSAGGFLSSHTGDGMMQFCCPQVHNTTNWPTISQPDLYYRNNQETIYHPHVNEIAPTQSRRGCLKTSPENESGCALSLLSMCPSQSSAISVGPIMSPSPPPQARNSTSLNLNSLVQLSFSQGSAALSSTNNTNSPGFGGFHSSQDGFRANGSSKFFPFGWDY